MPIELCKQIAHLETDEERIEVLRPLTRDAFEKWPKLNEICENLEPSKLLVILGLIYIDQIESLFAPLNSNFDRQEFFNCLTYLEKIDQFYREIGGLIGYHSKVLELLNNQSGDKVEDAKYHAPNFIDISVWNGFTKEAVFEGLEHLNEMAEIYPLGGAADRLHLVDETTNEELPAAKLKFAGKTLLERLILDLQAREYLYFLKKGKQIITPIAMMTSLEKDNHDHVLNILEENHYFGRPKESIRLFTQPLVPTVNEEGNWCKKAPFKPILKPGGHGAIWKLAHDLKVFEWLKGLGRKKALIRQINNPIAGLDYGLLAFTGIGCKKDMKFGFASAPRLIEAAEGVNVLVEKEGHFNLSNIEYCDFKKYGIEDLPISEGEPYSKFSSNTNILFVDLDAIVDAVHQCPFPGLLINLKKMSYKADDGTLKEEMMARLESTMQNIADVFVEEKKDELKTEKTFITYNKRHKTISTAKKVYQSDGPLRETPESCFYDLLFAARELLELCEVSLPERQTIQEMLENGPEFLFLYNPVLGPLYSKIMKKVMKGSFSKGSECILEISDLYMKNVHIDGSLQIIAEQPMGHFLPDKTLQFSNQIGSCYLENVEVDNQGVDWTFKSPFWRMDHMRKETVKIILKGKSRFIAKNVYLKGNQTFIVEDGETLEI